MASPTPASPISVESLKEQVLRMSDFFDTMLPGTLAHENIVVEFAPKFSDFRDYEYIRYPLLLRYGLADRWELRGGVTPFSPNPFNSGWNHRWGLGEGILGIRYDLGGVPMLYDDATIGVDLRTPIGKPPIDLNDSYTHFKPQFTAARGLPIPHTTFLTEITYDRQFGPGPVPAGVIRRNVTELAPGLLYKPGEYGLFLDYRYRVFDEPGATHLGREYKFGPIWDIPLARTAEWGLPGKWQVELAYRRTTEEGRKTNSGITARVHWKTTLKEVLKTGP